MADARADKRTATGGKAIYGVQLGILMLESKFPRVYGEIGNARTWPFPVHYKVIQGASPDRVVRHRGEGLVNAFIDGARELTDLGVDGITANCGFLALFQDQISRACPEVPVLTSSLMQYSMIKSTLPADREVGIITISAATLSGQHLAAAGIPADAAIVGTDEVGKELSRVILDGEQRMDIDLAEQDMLEAARVLLKKNPKVGAILLECANMTPYSAAVNAMTGLPVFDMYNLTCWFQSALAPRDFLRESKAGYRAYQGLI